MKETVLREAIEQYVNSEYENQKESSDVFSEELETKIQKLIESRKKPFYYLFNTIGKRVACIATAVVILAAGITVGVGASPDSTSYKVKYYKDKTKVTFITDGNEPYFIENYYAPSFIPEGYEMSDTLRDRSGYSVEYKNADGGEIVYRQSTLGGGSIHFYIDKDNIETLENGVYTELDTSKGYHWSNGKYTFTLRVYGDVSREELFKIAESLEDMNFVGPF